MAGPLHHQPQVVLAGEIDGGDDIGCLARLDDISAGRRRPGVEPPGDLRPPVLVSDVERVADEAFDIGAMRAADIVPAGGEERVPGEQTPAQGLP